MLLKDLKNVYEKEGFLFPNFVKRGDFVTILDRNWAFCRAANRDPIQPVLSRELCQLLNTRYRLIGIGGQGWVK